MYVSIMAIIHEGEDPKKSVRIRHDGPLTIIETKSKYCFEAMAEIPAGANTQMVEQYLEPATISLAEAIRAKL